MSGNMDLRYLEPGAIRFFRQAGVLRATLRDELSLLQANVVRMFPLTRPDAYFSVRDGAGREVGVLASREGLDPESAARVNEELDRRYMAPCLTAVRKMRERFGIVEWEVETNRGPCRFSTRDLRDNAIRLPNRQFVLVDVEGNRFDVPDLAKLDAYSQSCLIRHL